MRLYVILILTAFFSVFAFAGSQSSFESTVDASITMLNNRVSAVMGYIEGRLAELEDTVDRKLYGVERRVENLEKGLEVVNRIIAGLNDTLKTVYQNQVSITALVKKIAEKLQNLERISLENKKEIDSLKNDKEKEYDRLLIYTSLAVSALNTLLILLVIYFK